MTMTMLGPYLRRRPFRAADDRAALTSRVSGVLCSGHPAPHSRQDPIPMFECARTSRDPGGLGQPGTASRRREPTGMRVRRCGCFQPGPWFRGPADRGPNDQEADMKKQDTTDGLGGAGGSPSAERSSRPSPGAISRGEGPDGADTPSTLEPPARPSGPPHPDRRDVEEVTPPPRIRLAPAPPGLPLSPARLAVAPGPPPGRRQRPPVPIPSRRDGPRRGPVPVSPGPMPR